ncbi:hypothetical protein NOS3756_52270 [Nostoc sp. NIES-3756]|nr:hypothetical protein NOS3756_52270 [Nostoc sp. NIES-3756]
MPQSPCHSQQAIGTTACGGKQDAAYKKRLTEGVKNTFIDCHWFVTVHVLLVGNA